MLTLGPRTTDKSVLSKKVIFTYEGAFWITVCKLNGKDRYMVEYGKQQFIGTSVEAAHELGVCIMHSLSCEGKTDD